MQTINTQEIMRGKRAQLGGTGELKHIDDSRVYLLSFVGVVGPSIACKEE